MSDLFDYAAPPAPLTAPFVKGSETSKDAAERIAPALGYLQQVVLDTLSAVRPGLTTDEIEVRTGLRHQTASARVRELAQRGYIEATGEKRPTRSGRAAAVYVTREVRA